MQKIRETLSAVADGGKTVIIGDLNIDYRQVVTKSVKQLLCIEREFNLIQHIKTSTRVAITTDTLMDHIYSNPVNVMMLVPSISL